MSLQSNALTGREGERAGKTAAPGVWMTPGLVSVTFRQLSPAAIIALCRECGLAGIEWGGDVHVPPGSRAAAEAVAQRMADAGMQTVAYGSYYRAGQSEARGLAFGRVLETAVALGAPTIRVWAGVTGSMTASAEQRRSVLDDLRRIAVQAAAAGVRVATEFHDGTLCDTPAATLAVLATVAHDHLCTLWQPQHGLTTEENLAGLRLLLRQVAHVHVFHWWPGPESRRPLAEGIERWRCYLDELKAAAIPRWALLEFVRGDDPAMLLDEARTLGRLVTPSRPPGVAPLRMNGAG